MTDDIVARLRTFADTLLLGNFQGLAATTESAADEIERLRQLSGKAGQLRDERDEARRKICEIESQGTCDPEKYANLMGWDCFKENTDDR